MSLSPAAAAALGAVPAAPRPNRLAWVDVEDAPKMIEVLDPSTGDPLGWFAQVEEDVPLTDKMADRLRAICDHVDGHSCEADTCLASQYATDDGPVGAPIGWVLTGEADERTEWHSVTLIQRERNVVAVCATCSPSAQYPALLAPNS